MKKYKQIQIDQLDGYICDMCNKPLGDMEGHSTLSAHWGFTSNKDMQEHEADFCEKCYDKIVEFIKKNGGKIHEYYYDFHGGRELKNNT